uniref:Uncharacterized protein n=1 Tax=Fundulus heteroclitus TaxID=8078 RepID=A0A3Q2NXI3_FUNHE
MIHKTYIVFLPEKAVQVRLDPERKVKPKWEPLLLVSSDLQSCSFLTAFTDGFAIIYSAEHKSSFSAVNEPPEAVNEPPESVNEPSESVNEPSESVNEPSESVNEPSESVNEPSETKDSATCAGTLTTRC